MGVLPTRAAPVAAAVLPTRAALLTAAVLLTGVGTGTVPRAALDPEAAPGLRTAPVRLDGSGACTFPAKQIKGTPWFLQRVLLDQLWQGTDKGKGVRVAVIDTGVDDRNPQLSSAVDKSAGRDFLAGKRGGDPTDDQVGHGTKVAGIIAARPRAGTGFVGLAPKATIIPVRQNDADSTGDSDTMAQAITHAVSRGADVINISQDTTKPLSATSDLAQAVHQAIDKGVVVVASAGNDGLDGKARATYPAAFEGVLAVASSDRDNERASFSQAGSFVGVAAPGVDIVSTVPGGGQCADNGTSFSAPFVAGVAALLKEKHADWRPAQIITQIEQTAERGVNGHDDFVGWGVVDPVRAVQESDLADPPSTPSRDPGPTGLPAPDVAPFSLAETPEERDRRYAVYVVGATVVLATLLTGSAVVSRDLRRRRRNRQG
ncbi:type VII secretion-associated serine protease mycosin [Streptomyces sp. B3I8]|uniref:type VII secretion-associated serine protease mycosin n=1 Tax=Streptomyces sp. B3I8 TaxID=3042303 RepID=UPI002788BB66|nr:type VII secretion-associated serine protease mycosin [Streptomyces sp. B3I8]MDQ0789560.1 membrane-anchored mycosin MYCP [Streptomyces sp. B3I8]